MGVSNKFVYDASDETGKPLTTHQWYDGTQHPWEFKRVWHLEPSLTEPNTVYAGIEDAALFRSTDGGVSWKSCPGFAAATPGLAGSLEPGAVPAHDSSRSERSAANVHRHSAAGAFRTDDGGKTWKPINRGLRSQYFRTRQPKWDTAFTGSRSTGRARTRCSCRSTGT